jgi:uncharacterized protein (TIGR02594 family)
MVVFTAFGLVRIVAAVLSIVAVAAITAPASAKPLHRHHAHASRHANHYAHHRGYHHRFHSPRRHGRAMQRGQYAQATFGQGAQSSFGSAPNDQAWNYAAPAAQQQPEPQRVTRRHQRQNLHAQQPQQTASWSPSGFASNVVAEARSFIGRGNPTGRRSLWCARFMNMVLERSGHRGTGSDMASSFAHYGQRLSGPQVGAIAVMSRGRRGGHVGVVSGIDPNGNPIVVSGNHGHRVAESVYSKNRIYAYVMPSS